MVLTQAWVILQKKVVENHDTSQNTKHLSVPICLCQRETILKFDKFEIGLPACFKDVVTFVCVLIQYVHGTF